MTDRYWIWRIDKLLDEIVDDLEDEGIPTNEIFDALHIYVETGRQGLLQANQTNKEDNQ